MYREQQYDLSVFDGPNRLFNIKMSGVSLRNACERLRSWLVDPKLIILPHKMNEVVKAA